MVIALWVCPSEAELLVKKKIKPVSFFVNRSTETETLEGNLEKYKTVSLVGVTSIGKTETLRRYASLYQAKYKLIWFFDTSTDLNEQFLLLAIKINKSFNLQGKERLSEEANNSKKEVMEFLSTKGKWLLVFDNLRINENEKVEDIINWNHSGHIIISSQDSKNLPHVTYLYKLNKEHALSLVQNILTTKGDTNYLEKIINIYKGYPGPIVQSAMLLKEHNYLSVDEYEAILESSDDPIVAHMEIIKKLLDIEDNKLLLKIALINNQYFSRGILKLIISDSTKIGNGLYNLHRFGLIKNIEKMNNNTIFEMHDTVKAAVLDINQNKVNTEAINDIINKLNELMPKGVGSRYSFMNSDPTLRSNLEIILLNAEKYNVNIHKILELRQHLITYYMAILDHYNWEKMKQWLEHKEAEGAINPYKMNEKEKANYSWYMLTIGMYEDFVKSNYINALLCFDKASEAIKNIKVQPELKSTILFQTAQTQAFGGDITNAEKNMVEADNLIQQYKNADYDMGLYWFIKAKIALARGKYSDALLAVDENIKAESHLPQDTFTAPTYILQAEILNFLEKYKESYKISQRIYKQEIGSGKAEHEIHARIITQLAKAELGLGLVDAALVNANLACEIFKKENEKYKIESVINIDFASALVVLGDILTEKKDFENALETYNEAEAIYHRRYGSNYRYLDEISYLLAQGTRAACMSKNAFWQKHYQDQLFTYFGEAHVRSLEVLKLCNNSSF